MSFKSTVLSSMCSGAWRGAILGASFGWGNHLGACDNNFYYSDLRMAYVVSGALCGGITGALIGICYGIYKAKVCFDPKKNIDDPLLPVFKRTAVRATSDIEKYRHQNFVTNFRDRFFPRAGKNTVTFSV